MFKLLNWKDKVEILKASKKLQGSGLFFNEDFSDATMKIRNEKMKEVRANREKGLYSVLVYDKVIARHFR